MPQPIQPSPPRSNGEDAQDYLFDMIAELAALARRSGETVVAIYLEAILAAREVENSAR